MRARPRPNLKRPSADKRGAADLALLALCFIGGAACGAFIGAGSLYAGETLALEGGAVYGSDSFWPLLFACSKYHLAVIAAATSLLGMAAIPAAFAARGFALSCTAASIAAAYPERALALILLILGLPSVLAVPSLFLLGHEGLSFSRRIRLSFGRRPALPDYRDRAIPLTVSLAALPLAALAELSAVPALLARLL